MNLTGTILVANCDRMASEFFDIILSKLKFDVIKAVSGPDVLKKVKKYSIDLILLDLNLPKIDGIKITRTIRKSKDFRKYRNVPIIIFSSEDSPEEKVRGFENGADDFITKPFNFCEVLARIRTILRHKALLNHIIKKERRLAILESLNTNLISFTKHIKKPLISLYRDSTRIDYESKNSIKNFKNKFEEYYKEMNAMLSGLEEEISDFRDKHGFVKNDGFSYEDLEKKIDKHLKRVK